MKIMIFTNDQITRSASLYVKEYFLFFMFYPLGIDLGEPPTLLVRGGLQCPFFQYSALFSTERGSTPTDGAI